MPSSQACLRIPTLNTPLFLCVIVHPPPPFALGGAGGSQARQAPPAPLPPAAVQGPLGEGKPDMSPLSMALAEPAMHI